MTTFEWIVIIFFGALFGPTLVGKLFGHPLTKGRYRARAKQTIMYNKIYQKERDKDNARQRRGHPQAQTPVSSVPAGWYNDPHGGQFQRYWDGTRWTASTTPHVT
jgi:hypothetical protein